MRQGGFRELSSLVSLISYGGDFEEAGRSRGRRLSIFVTPKRVGVKPN